MSDPKSKTLFERAKRVIPGGVNSPVRAFRAVGGTPVFVSRAARARTSAAPTARSTSDYVGSWGPMILGHAHPAVVERDHARRPRAGRATARRPSSRCASPRRSARSIRRSRWCARSRAAPRRRWRAPRGARLHRARRHREVRGVLPRARRLSAREGGLAARPRSASPTRRGCRRSVAQTRLTLALQRRRRAAGALRGARGRASRPSSSSRWSGNMGVVPPAPGFLEALVERVREARRGLDLRRGDDRVSRRARRDAGARGACSPT